jgi:hypothetical protein
MNTPTPETPGSTLARWAAAWDRFFFRPADPTTLGMIRICCGLIAVYTLIAFSLDLQTFFGEHAWYDLKARLEQREKEPVLAMPFTWQAADPHDVYHRGVPDWSIWYHVTDPTAMAAVHTFLIIATFLFTIGLCTRITSVIAWFAMISCIHRSPTTVFGVDTMMTIALLYLMIGPSGAALSVDRLIRRWWVTYRSLRRQESGGVGRPAPSADLEARLEVQPSVSANFAIRLFQIHLCIIYLAAGLSKLQGHFWWTGEAIWGTLANWEFSPMQYWWYNDFLLFLSNNRLAWEVFMTGGTLFTLMFEIGFAFLIWGRRTRWMILAMAVTLHGGIGLFMGLKTFSMMMLTLCLAFVPPEAIRRLLRNLGRGPTGMRLFFALPQRRQVRAASFVHALDLWNQVELVGQGGEQVAVGGTRKGAEKGKASGPKEAMESRGPRLATPDGRMLTGLALAGYLLGKLGIFRVFYPWAWFTSGRYSITGAAATRPPVVHEAAPMRGPNDIVKSGSPHVKQKR